MRDSIEVMWLLTKLGIEYKTYAEPQYLHGHEKIKQCYAINVGPLDFNFNRNGKFLGWNTDNANSFRKPRRKK